MARKPAVQIICDRTGEASILQVGMTLENMNEQSAQAGPALELCFRPSGGGDQIVVKFDDLCERSERQVEQLVKAIGGKGYYLISELVEGDPAVSIAVEDKTCDASAHAPAPAPEPARKTRGRRTHVEIESDELDARVETASSAVDKIRQDPEADELAVADAREVLREGLQLRAWFKAQTEKHQKEYVSAARKTRKAGGTPRRPSPLPALTDEELRQYGFVTAQVEDHGDHPDATTGDDDDDIFGAAPDATPTPGAAEQVDFL